MVVPAAPSVVQAAPISPIEKASQSTSATQPASTEPTGGAKENSRVPSPEKDLEKHILDADEDLAEEIRETNAMAELQVAIILRDEGKRATRLKDIVERYAGTEAAKIAARLLYRLHRGESTT